MNGQRPLMKYISQEQNSNEKAFSDVLKGLGSKDLTPARFALQLNSTQPLHFKIAALSLLHTLT